MSSNHKKVTGKRNALFLQEFINETCDFEFVVDIEKRVIGLSYATILSLYGHTSLICIFKSRHTTIAILHKIRYNLYPKKHFALFIEWLFPIKVFKLDLNNILQMQERISRKEHTTNAFEAILKIKVCSSKCQQSQNASMENVKCYGDYFIRTYSSFLV